MESKNVGEMAQLKDFLGRSLINSGGSDSDDVSGSDVRELELEGKSVPCGCTAVSKSKFIGVFVHFVDVGDLSKNIEVSFLALDFVQGNEHIVGDHWV